MIKKEKLLLSARKLCDAGVKLLYPPRCPCCDQIRPLRGLVRPSRDIRPVTDAALAWVCEDCRGKLPWVTEPACMKCGKPTGNSRLEFCRDCARMDHLFDCGRAAFAYTGQIRRSVYRMKFQNRRDYLDFFAEAMTAVGEPYLRLWRPERIVPIPMHVRKRAARGYNQAELLAEKISRLTGIPCDKKLLQCVRYTDSQKELGRSGRLKNLRGSFEARPPEDLAYPGYSGYLGQPGYLPESVLLVDDVYTTGSTMDEAARALKAAGVRRVFFLVLCTGNRT